MFSGTCGEYNQEGHVPAYLKTSAMATPELGHYTNKIALVSSLSFYFYF